MGPQKLAVYIEINEEPQEVKFDSPIVGSYEEKVSH